VADSHQESGDEGKHRRGLKFRQRDDYAVVLFHEAKANLHDRQRIDRILLELGRFYNPYINAPIVDLATRRRILELLEAGQTAEADEILDERLILYSRAPGTED